MSELKGMIEAEKNERSAQDDGIITALNQLAHQLESSLSVISA